MRGDSAGSRYYKFGWNDLRALPSIGKVDYQPKGGAFRTFKEGTFSGEHLLAFPAKKERRKLEPLGHCVFCARDKDEFGETLKLTSEHVIPEFLGAGLELPQATCSSCQRVTAEYERSLAEQMFDPVRASYSLKGKDGALEKTNFPLDVGRETTEHEFIPLIYYPTILVLPRLFPASSFSRRSPDAEDIFGFWMFNINADTAYLDQYSVDNFSSQSVDMVRLAQLIAKIAHVGAANYLRTEPFRSTVAEFVRTNYPPTTRCTSHLEHVGCLWQANEKPSENLHEIEVGKIFWNDRWLHATRVRLFACCDAPSYYVTVGQDQSGAQ